VVFTDGHENDSREWTKEALFKLITEKEKEGWTFVFLGANQDSYATGHALGIKGKNTQNFSATAEGTEAAWGSMKRAMSQYRTLTPEQKLGRKANFYNDIKEAEEEMRSR